MVVLIGPDMLSDFGANVLAELACLAAAAFYAFGAVFSRRVRGVPPVMMATGQLTMSTVLLLPVVLLFDRPGSLLTASRTAIWAMLALALLSSALAYLIYFRLIARAGATNALIVTFLLPVSAILLGIVLLNEIAGCTANRRHGGDLHRRRRHRRPGGAFHRADAAPLNSCFFK